MVLAHAGVIKMGKRKNNAPLHHVVRRGFVGDSRNLNNTEVSHIDIGEEVNMRHRKCQVQSHGVPVWAAGGTRKSLVEGGTWLEDCRPQMYGPHRLWQGLWIFLCGKSGASESK